MRHTLLALLACLVAVSGAAQRHGSFSERLFNAKVGEIAYRLTLTDEQVAKFRPIYEQYNKDMIAAWGDDEVDAAAKTSAEAAERVKQRMERQQRAQSIRIAYTDRFATVLTPGQLQRFYRVESDIQRRLRQRKSAGRSPRSRR